MAWLDDLADLGVTALWIGPIDWTDRHGLRNDTKKLIALRRGTPVLHSREWLPLTVEPATRLFAYQRTGYRLSAIS